MLRKNHRGQTAVEYSILLIIVIGALLTAQNYVKRGIQGRWQESIDDMGDQYDPQRTISHIRHALESTTNTVIMAQDEAGGYWTQRTDKTSSTETKTGNVEVGTY